MTLLPVLSSVGVGVGVSVGVGVGQGSRVKADPDLLLLEPQIYLFNF